MKNLLKEKLANHQKVFGVMMQMDSAVAAEAFGASGLDFCIIDTEHAVIDSETMRRLVTAAELRRVTPLVRIKRISSDFVQTALDMGARQGRNFAPERQQDSVNLFEAAVAHARNLAGKGKRVLFASWSEGSSERLGTMLSDHGLTKLPFALRVIA